MGYRSDVALGIIFPNADEAVRFIASARMAVTPWQEKEFDYWKVRTGDNYVLLHVRFDDVKWYPSYDDVMFHEKLLTFAAEQTLSTAKVIVGEDDTDITRDIIGDENDPDELMQVLYGGFSLIIKVVSPHGGAEVSTLFKQEKTDATQ